MEQRQQAYNIRLEKWARPDIEAWVEALQAAGMQVERVGHMLGIVSGTIPDEALATIREMEAVSVVAPDREATLPPQFP